MQQIPTPAFRIDAPLSARASEIANRFWVDLSDGSGDTVQLLVPNLRYARDLAGAINAIRDLHAAPAEKVAA